MGYVGSHGVATLRKYNYSGVDHSIVAKYILQPFWSRFVNIFPLWFLIQHDESSFAGETLRIPVPVGTVVRRKKGSVLADLAHPGDEVLVARGGQGGVTIGAAAAAVPVGGAAAASGGAAAAAPKGNLHQTQPHNRASRF